MKPNRFLVVRTRWLGRARSAGIGTERRRCHSDAFAAGQIATAGPASRSGSIATKCSSSARTRRTSNRWWSRGLISVRLTPAATACSTAWPARTTGNHSSGSSTRRRHDRRQPLPAGEQLGRQGAATTSPFLRRPDRTSRCRSQPAVADSTPDAGAHDLATGAHPPSPCSTASTPSIG